MSYGFRFLKSQWDQPLTGFWLGKMILLLLPQFSAEMAGAWFTEMLKDQIIQHGSSWRVSGTGSSLLTCELFSVGVILNRTMIKTIEFEVELIGIIKSPPSPILVVGEYACFLTLVSLLQFSSEKRTWLVPVLDRCREFCLSFCI